MHVRVLHQLEGGSWQHNGHGLVSDETVALAEQDRVSLLLRQVFLHKNHVAGIQFKVNLLSCQLRSTLVFENHEGCLID